MSWASRTRLTQNPLDRVADHDIDDQVDNTQTNIYAGRGLLIESTAGPVWLVGTAVEHHTLYNYQLSGTRNIYASQLQTETPYFQPHPNSLSPFAPNSALGDPTFDCTGVSGNCAMAWGLRVVSSSGVFLYGANHYSFFNDYSTSEFSPFPAVLEIKTPLLSLQPVESTPVVANEHICSMLDIRSRPDVPGEDRRPRGHQQQHQHLQPQHDRVDQHAGQLRDHGCAFLGQ
jgi:hypothetical protein